MTRRALCLSISIAILASPILAEPVLAEPVLAEPVLAENMSTTLDGVFNQVQVERGERLLVKHCSKCHDVNYFKGVFLKSWRNQPIQGLYDLIRASMPEDRPGALKERQYADLLAYIFAANGMPVGDKKLNYKNGHLKSILIQLHEDTKESNKVSAGETE